MLSGKAPFFGCCGDNCGWERGENCVKCQVCKKTLQCLLEKRNKLFLVLLGYAIVKDKERRV